MTAFRLALLCLFAGSLTSCEQEFDLQVANSFTAAVTVQSGNRTVKIAPGEVGIVPFPQREEGWLLRMVTSGQSRCYHLDLPQLQRDRLRLMDHHIAQSRLDAALRLHFPDASAAASEQVVQGAPCG